MDEVDPRNAEHFPNALTRGQANDFLFSTGRDIRPYVVDQMYKEKYGKKEGVPNRSQYNVDTKNVKDTKGNLRYPKKKEFTPEIKNRIDSLWNANLPQWNKLSYDDQQALMGLGRQSYGRAINRGPGEGNENLEQYNEVWHGRIPNLNSANYDKPVWWDQDNKRYGGNMIAQFNNKQYGGLPTAQTGIQQSDDDYYWVNSEGVKFDPMTGQEIDSDELSYFDPKGITKQLGKMKQYLGHDLWKGNPNDISLPPVSGYGEAPTANALAARQMISKLNPYNVPSDGVAGVFDYLGNAINFPLSGINKLATGKVGTTGNLYTDVLMDPLTYTGLAPAKWTAEAVIKYGPKVGSFIAKHGTKALKYLGKYGDIAVEAIKKYGQKGIDYVIEKTPEIAKQLGKALTSETAQNIGTSLISRGTAGMSQEKKKDQKVEKLEKEIARLKSAPTTAATPTSVLLPKKAKTSTKSITETEQPQTFNWTTN